MKYFFRMRAIICQVCSFNFENLTFLSFVAPCILYQCGGHPERPQLDQCVHGRKDVFMEPGHALTATGNVSQPQVTSHSHR